MAMTERYFIDWGGNKDRCIISNEAGEQIPRQDLLKFMRQHRRAEFYIESTFESFDWAKRNLMLAEEYDIRVISPRATANYRQQHEIEKSDTNDSCVILRLWKEGHNFIRPRPMMNNSIDKLSATAREFYDRGWPIEDRRIFIAKIVLELRRRDYPEDQTEQFLTLLPKAGKDPVLAPVENDGGYAPIAIAMVIAAVHTVDRNEYEQLIGLHENGYPSIWRSAFYRDRLRVLLKQSLGEKKMAQIRTHAEFKSVKKEVSRGLRRAVRAIKHHVDAAMTGTPRTPKRTPKTPTLTAPRAYQEFSLEALPLFAPGQDTNRSEKDTKDSHGRS